MVIVTLTLLTRTSQDPNRPTPAYASRALVAPGLLGSLPSLAPNLPTSLPGLGLGLALSKPAGSGGAAIRIAWGLIALTNLLAWRMFPRQEGETYTRCE